MAWFARFFGRTVGEGAAFAAGTAVGPTLRPIVQDLQNDTWSAHPSRPISADFLAQGVAQRQVDFVWAQEEAQRTGISAERFQKMIQIANVGPGVAAAFEMFRRDVVKEPGFRKAVGRLGLEDEWIDDLVKLKELRITPAEVANAVQQGHMPNPDILPNISAAVRPAVGVSAPDTPDGQPPSHVPLTQIDIDPIAEAEAHGIPPDRLRVLANLVGLPPGPEALLTMWNRGLIDEDSVDAGIREGHMKTKWTGAFKRMRWAVLSAPEYAEARLRDWISVDQMNAGGALTGHTHEQMDLLFKNRGRPASPTQMWTAWARKIIGPRGVPTDFPDHEDAIRRSNIRPEYAGLLWGIRYVYPPLFQLGRLVQSGAIDSDTAATWAEYNRYGPEVVAALKQYWDRSTGSTIKGLTASTLLADYEGGFLDSPTFLARLEALGYSAAEAQLYAELGDARRVKSARDATLSTIRTRYVSWRLSHDEMLAQLNKTGIAQEAKDRIVVEWDNAREATRTGLSAAQVKQAYRQLHFLRQDAIQLLENLGWRHSDAVVYLDTPKG